mgnify:CR=1 FL=1
MYQNTRGKTNMKLYKRENILSRIRGFYLHQDNIKQNHLIEKRPKYSSTLVKVGAHR